MKVIVYKGKTKEVYDYVLRVFEDKKTLYITFAPFNSIEITNYDMFEVSVPDTY